MRHTDLSTTRLSRNLALATLAFAVVVALVIAGIELWRADKADQRAVEDQFAAIETGIVDSASNTLWSYDTSELGIIAAGVKRQANISLIEILDHEQSLIRLGEAVSGAVTREYPLQKDAETIGRLVVSIDREAIRARTLARFGNILFVNLILIALVAGFVMLLVEQWVMRHLRHAVGFIISRNSSNLHESLLLNRHRMSTGDDELDLLTKGVGRMQQELACNIAQLEKDIARGSVRISVCEAD